MSITFEFCTIAPKLHQGSKRLQCDLYFMNKIERRSNIEFILPTRLSDLNPAAILFIIIIIIIIAITVLIL